ncbi:MAG: PP2C family serine/threonine-protein phosphatase [bacterium]
MLIRAVGLGNQGVTPLKNDDHFCIGPFVEQTAFTSVVTDTNSSLFQQYGLLVAVADGIGGYAGGGLASRLALETLSVLFYAEPRGMYTDSRQLAADVAGYLERTQELLAGKLARSPSLAEAGTTIAGIVLVPPDYLVVFHAGDSRVLRSNKGFVRRLTVDHTPVGADLDTGRLLEPEAVLLPDSHKLTRSLGMQGDSRVEVNVEYAWDEGDIFFIGTDGWHGLGTGVPHEFIRDEVRIEQHAEKMARSLVEKAVELDGHDNVTLVTVEIAREGAKSGH